MKPNGKRMLYFCQECENIVDLTGKDFVCKNCEKTHGLIDINDPDLSRFGKEVIFDCSLQYIYKEDFAVFYELLIDVLNKRTNF